MYLSVGSIPTGNITSHTGVVNLMCYHLKYFGVISVIGLLAGLFEWIGCYLHTKRWNSSTHKEDNSVYKH